ncbi:MAG: lipopolysaccharide heptosyltransferase II [Candidatus Desulfofervidaceae bacterium]|nr:lipopolysaccharide heptosyltransferase II [Candidatus Desulfofervidaceae bacterium]
MDKRPARILVRSPNWLGDAVMALPFLANLRRTYPEAHIAIWCKPHLKDLFQAYPEIDEIVIYPSSFGSLLKHCLALRHRFRMCILLPNSFSSAMAAFLTATPIRIGYATDARGLFLTRSFPPPSDLHQIDYYLHLLTLIGYQVVPCAPVLKPTVAGEREKSILEKQHCWQKNYVVFAPGAAYGPAKCWPPTYFATLAQKIIHEMKLNVLVLGSKKDKSIAQEILNQMENTQGIYDLTGLTSLAGAMAIIKTARLVITNDSGLMHLTAALHCPQIAIFGPTDPNRTSPYGNTTKIIHHPIACAPCKYRECPKDHLCMRQITVKEVFEAIKEWRSSRTCY